MTALLRAALISTLLVLATGLGGCVYRPNIQQGNLLKIEDVDQVTVGMTRSQVRYLLGTPMLADPFDPQRWDYIYTLRRGRESKVDRAHFVVRFEGDRVSSVDKLDLPDVGGIDPRQQKREEKIKEQVTESGGKLPPPRPEVETKTEAQLPGDPTTN